MIKKSLFGFLIQGIGSGTAFMVQFYLAKKFGASEFGKFNYYFGIIGFNKNTIKSNFTVGCDLNVFDVSNIKNNSFLIYNDLTKFFNYGK